MIIRLGASSQLLITQPEHAGLAGRIMQHWLGDLAGSPRRAEILVAVNEHDNGWRDVDAAPIVDPATGRLLDFIRAPDHVRQDVWPRGVECLATTPYAAALVAQHALEIYARYRTDRAWQRFFADMERTRDHHLRRASGAPEDLRSDYAFVRIGDLISLTFCNEWQAEHACGAYRIRLQGETIVVTPDPFGGRSIPFEIAGVELPAAPFSSIGAALDALRQGRRRTLTGTARGG